MNTIEEKMISDVYELTEYELEKAICDVRDCQDRLRQLRKAESVLAKIFKGEIDCQILVPKCWPCRKFGFPSCPIKG